MIIIVAVAFTFQANENSRLGIMCASYIQTASFELIHKFQCGAVCLLNALETHSEATRMEEKCYIISLMNANSKLNDFTRA